MSSESKFYELVEAKGIVDDIRKSISMLSVFTRLIREKDKIIFEAVCTSLALHAKHINEIIDNNQASAPANEDPE